MSSKPFVISVAHARELVISAAEVELGFARRLAWDLPSTSTYEEHCDLALQIGAAGRRIERLLSLYDEERTFMKRVATPLVSSVTYKQPPQYLELISVFEPGGMRVFCVVAALKECLKDCSRSLRESSIAESMKTLCNLARTRKHRTLKSWHCARRGNNNQLYDKRWRLNAPGAPLISMPRIEHDRGLHKLHHTAFRETVASEVAALNIYEYDGLPWRFYIDMARQCEDEARHALMAAKRLRQLGGRLGQFPLTHFGNFYQMFWEMTLSERLVGLNLDIEAVGQSYLGEVSKRAAKFGDSETSNLYEFIREDEQRHARIGARWFTYLYPNGNDRREALDEARAMSALCLGSAHAHACGGTVEMAISSWIAKGTVLTRSPLPKGWKRELEVTMLTARRLSNTLHKQPALT